jgi:hypothetical protein
MKFKDAVTPDSIGNLYVDSVATLLLKKDFSTDSRRHPQSPASARRIQQHHSTITGQIMDKTSPQSAPVNPLSSTNPDKEVN